LHDLLSAKPRRCEWGICPWELALSVQSAREGERMAQVTVRVKMNYTFEVTCEGTNEDEVIQDIIDNNRLEEDVMVEANDCFEIESATYDKPEPIEDEDNSEEKESA
jgi:hypothetical protein